MFAQLLLSVGDTRIHIPGVQTPVVVRTYDSDIIVFWEIFVKQCYQNKIPDTAKVIVDGGANTGLSTVYFTERFPHAKVIAIEPEGHNLEILKTNCSRYPNVSVVKSAIWGEKTHLRIANPQSSGWGFVVEATTEDDPQGFPATTISEIVSEFDLESIDLLKLDIEGSERSVFSSNDTSWLNRVESLIVELHDYERPGCRPPVMRACRTAQLELDSEVDHVCYFSRLNSMKAIRAM